MYIPVFEIKDSFIVKHKLQYDTTCSELPYKMMFMDYDLARKSQTTNAVNFSGVTMDIDLSGVSCINMTYFNDEYNIHLDGDLSHEDVFSGTTVINNSEYQQYYVPNGSLYYDENERVEVNIYQKDILSGTTFWNHTSYVPNDIWNISGTTDNGLQWTVSGITTDTGYTSGYTNWYVDDITPILAYLANVENTGSTYIQLDKLLEDYLYNNLIKNYENLYYSVTSLNHSNANYIDLYLKFLLFPRINNFETTLNTDSIHFQPIFNNEEIYFNYDALTITMSGTSQVYTFETDCLYNKYNLIDFFSQLGYGYNAAIYNGYSTNVINESGYTYGDYYMTLIIPSIEDITPYTYMKVETDSGNTYNVVVSEVTGGTITIITPLNYINGETITEITNLWNVGDISNALQTTYENYAHNEYRKHHIQIQKKIYNAYAEIINQNQINQEIRLLISGIIFENHNKIMVLKVFDPADFIDERLLYEPIEIVRIGKDRKTTIPVTIKEFTKGIAADVIDSNIYSVYLFDPRIEDVLVIDANDT